MAEVASLVSCKSSGTGRAMTDYSGSGVGRAERGKQHSSNHYFKTIFLLQEPLSPLPQTRQSMIINSNLLINNNAPNIF